MKMTNETQQISEENFVKHLKKKYASTRITYDDRDYANRIYEDLTLRKVGLLCERVGYAVRHSYFLDKTGSTFKYRRWFERKGNAVLFEYVTDKGNIVPIARAGCNENYICPSDISIKTIKSKGNLPLEVLVNSTPIKSSWEVYLTSGYPGDSTFSHIEYAEDYTEEIKIDLGAKMLKAELNDRVSDISEFIQRENKEWFLRGPRYYDTFANIDDELVFMSKKPKKLFFNLIKIKTKGEDLKLVVDESNKLLDIGVYEDYIDSKGLVDYFTPLTQRFDYGIKLTDLKKRNKLGGQK